VHHHLEISKYDEGKNVVKYLEIQITKERKYAFSFLQMTLHDSELHQLSRNAFCKGKHI
jgi:hypothetical protein